MTTGKDILDNTFELTFRRGAYLSQLGPLDALGMIDRKKQMTVLLKLCESLDEINDAISNLNRRLDELNVKKPEVLEEKHDTIPPKRSR